MFDCKKFEVTFKEKKIERKKNKNKKVKKNKNNFKINKLFLYVILNSFNLFNISI